MDGVVAGAADDERLATFPGHEVHPRGPFGLTRSVEVGEPADLVDLDAVPLSAKLALTTREPLGDLAVTVRGGVGDAVERNRVPVPPEGYPSEPCDQWCPAGPFDLRFEAGPQPVWCPDLGLVTGRHRGYRGAVLHGQGPQHRALHDPFEPVQPVDVPGEQVVLDEPPVLGSERGDDGVVVLVDQVGAVRGFSAPGVPGGLGLNHRPWDVQLDEPVGPPAVPGSLAVVVMGGDLVAEEPCRL